MRIGIVIPTLFIFIQMSLVLSVNEGGAACINPSLSAEAIQQFKFKPEAIVAPNSDTRTVEATTRDVAATDASLAADLIRVAKGAAPRLQTAIAAGLAQAALACAGQDQRAAQQIQEAVAGFQDAQFQAAFAAVAGDLSTAATNAAASSAASSAGSVVATGANSSGRSGSSGGGGGVSAFFQLTSTGLALGTTTGLSTTAADSVSPTQ